MTLLMVLLVEEEWYGFRILYARRTGAAGSLQEEGRECSGCRIA
jgi:hypothetical protein